MKMRWVQAKAWRHVFAFHNFEAPASCINCHPTMFCHVLPVAAACRSGLRTLRYSAEGACSLCRCLLGASHTSWEHQHGPERLYFKHQRPHCNLNFLTLQNLLPGISVSEHFWNLILLFGIWFCYSDSNLWTTLLSLWDMPVEVFLRTMLNLPVHILSLGVSSWILQGRVQLQEIQDHHGKRIHKTRRSNPWWP